MKQRFKVGLFIFGIFLPTLSFSAQYKFTTLGALDRTFSRATDINNAGQVVGYVYEELNGRAQNQRAFIYESSVIAALSANSSYSHANGINDRGQIVGGPRSFLYQDGMIGDIKFVTDNNAVIGIVTANSINDSGQIVGTAFFGNDYNHQMGMVIVEKEGHITALGNLRSVPLENTTYHEGFDKAIDINNLGQVVGYSFKDNNYYGAFLYESGEMLDLSEIGGFTRSVANGINDLGQVVGHSSSGSSGLGAQQAFLYDNGEIIDLGVLQGGSIANDINNLGQVVGVSGTGSRFEGEQAFLYEGGNMIDLSSLVDETLGDWELIEATAINDYGWIVGSARHSEFNDNAFLLIPVPEPSTNAMMALGIFALLTYSSRQSLINLLAFKRD